MFVLFAICLAKQGHFCSLGQVAKALSPSVSASCISSLSLCINSGLLIFDYSDPERVFICRSHLYRLDFPATTIRECKVPLGIGGSSLSQAMRNLPTCIEGLRKVAGPQLPSFPDSMGNGPGFRSCSL